MALAREHIVAVMREAGWRYDSATHGFRRKIKQHPMLDHLDDHEWVTFGQASEAIANAEAGIEAAPELAASETVARAIAGVAND